MAANYLHGAETTDVILGTRQIKVIKAAVIALVGVAPKGPKQTLTLVSSEADAAQFGAMLPGFNIPKSLKVIQAHGLTTILVVNIFDETTHTTAVSLEAHTITLGKTKLTFPNVAAAAPSVFKVDGTTPVTAVAGTDYSIDDFGNFKVLTNHADLVDGTVIKISYKKFATGTVTSGDLVGTYNSGTGARTGWQLMDTAYNTFGIKPKQLICPYYTGLSGVYNEMDTKALKFRGIAYRDAPVGTTYTVALAGRGPSGAINFNVSNRRTMLFFPHVKRFDDYTNANENFPLSAYMAGLRCKVIKEEGYHVSTSNHALMGLAGMEIPITAAINDASTEANALNEVGITTMFNSGTSGIRAWGNHSSAFPSSTTPDNFECVMATKDIVEDSIEESMIQWIDKPLNGAIADSIVESVNQFFRTLVGRGAILDGLCSYDPAKNPDSELAVGHLTLDITFMPPTPMERVTFASFMDTSMIGKALAAVGQ